MSEVVASDLVGSWSLIEWRIEYPDGRVTYPFGVGAQGRLMYSADGRMTAQIAQRDRAALPLVPRTAADAERAAAFDSFFAYSGRFHIEGETVVHVVDIALNPNFVGSQQRRRMSLQERRLELSASEPYKSGERRNVLLWERESEHE